MTITEIQEIGKIVTQLGGTAKETFVVYFAAQLIESIIPAIVWTGVIFGVYRVCMSLIRNLTFATRIAQAAGKGSMENMGSRDEEKVIQSVKTAFRGED